ncbi:Mdm33 family-domain-containing protein [Geopyxis carbonaria]|nr:Mdm33 family-domain-containing protein [Geopyxis carbonaria]
MRPLIRCVSARTVCCSVARPLHLRNLPKASTSQQSPFQPQQIWQKARSFSSEINKSSSPSSSTSSSSPPSTPAPAPEDLKNLPSQQESRRSDVSKRFSHAMDDLQTALFSAGQKLNDLTGYSDIETLKKSIEQQEKNVQNSRLEVRDAKENYQAAINRRSASQREVNELLQRKHAWSPTDLERFTELYRSDHANEQNETAAQERLTVAEQTADEVQAQLARSILARYHEEQIWSDKIRRASTWGTWGLVGFNVLLFIVVQLGLEPWKRRRLVKGFEEKVREVMQEENMRNALLQIHPDEANAAETVTEKLMEVPALAAASASEAGSETAAEISAIAEEAVLSPPTPSLADVENVESVMDSILPKPMAPELSMEYANYIKEMVEREVKALFSEETIVLTQKELTIGVAGTAAVGIAVGASITGVVLRLLFSQR